MQTDDSKVCCGCRVRKPLTEFQKRSTTKDGRTTQCKACTATKRKILTIRNGGYDRKKTMAQIQAEKSAKVGRTEKACKKCGVVKPMAQFKNRTNTADGKFYDCRDCSNKVRNIRRAKLRKEEAAAVRDYYRRNKEAIAGRRRADRATERYKKAQEVAAERIRKTKLRWYYKTKATDPDRFREYALVATNNRRAYKAAAGGSFTKEEIDALFKRQGGKCAVCKKKLSKKKRPLRYHMDHVTPLSKGGSNGIENIALTCGPCNLRKHNKDPIEWANKHGLLFY